MALLTETLISDIFKLHSENLTNREIAKKLSIHHKTVGAYLKSRNLVPNGNGPKKAKYVDGKVIICSKCNTEQFEDNFLLCRKDQQYPYRLSYCNSCRRQQLLINMNSDKLKVLRDIYLRTKQRCKKNNNNFELDFDVLIEIYKKQNGSCFYSGTEMDLVRGKGSNWKSCTIDKVIPSRGYTNTNIVLCTRRFNTVKNNLSLIEIKEHMPNWYRKLVCTDWLSLGEV